MTINWENNFLTSIVLCENQMRWCEITSDSSAQFRMSGSSKTKASHSSSMLITIYVFVVTRGVNRLSIIRNSIEKTDYRLWINVIDNRKLVWQYGDPSPQLTWWEKEHIMRYLFNKQAIPVSENTTHSCHHGRKTLTVSKD